MLAIETYKAIDLYEFFRLCLHIDQTLRDVENKSRDYCRSELIELSIELILELIRITTRVVVGLGKTHIGQPNPPHW
jgi:hypothetical protein